MKMDFFTGKLQDLGLKFSHETPKVAAGDLANKGDFFFLNFVNWTQKIFSNQLTTGDKRIIVSYTSS